MRRIAWISLAFCTLAAGQNVDSEVAFFRSVQMLGSRAAGGQPVDAVARLREDLGISTSAAEAVFSAVREYRSGLDAIDNALRRSILERRMRVMEGENVISEPELLSEASKRRSALLERTMQDLKSNLGTREGQALRTFIEQGAPNDDYFPMKPGETWMKAMVN